MPDAAVQIGNMPRNDIVRDYYNRCGFETIGPARIPTGDIKTFSTLEELIDLLLSRSELHQVIVNHGNDSKGLLIPFAAGTKYNATGLMMGTLSRLANRASSGSLSSSDKDVVNAASMMGVTAAVVIRIADKLVKLRQKKQ